MREPFAKRIIAAMEEVVASLKQGKKAKEGMQESGKDKFVNEKKMQTKVNPMGIRNDKEPADVPLDVDQLSYSKKGKQKFIPVPPNQQAVYDANTAKGKDMPKDKEKKHDMNRIEQIHSAWQANKKAKEEEKYDINRVEKIHNEKKETDKKSDSYFGNFDGHDGHSSTTDKPNSKLKKDKSDYEGGNF